MQVFNIGVKVDVCVRATKKIYINVQLFMFFIAENNTLAYINKEMYYFVTKSIFK